MNTDFPEAIFDSKLKNSPIYNYKSKSGELLCKSKKIIFAGICRDVEDTLALNIERVIRTAKHFQDFHIFLYENDSTDSTVKILNQYSKNTKLTFISESRKDEDYRKNIYNGVDPWHHNRCKILAECRNIYLEEIESHFSDYDYLCVLDWDIKGGWSYTGFNHAMYLLESDKHYACVSSYGVLSEPNNVQLLEEVDVNDYIMYDSLAFRPLNMNKGIHILRTPAFNKITFDRGDDPSEVASNFGGMALYKIPTLKNKRYAAKQWEEGEIDPDHVGLHNQLRDEGFKIILDPNMIVSYSDHSFSRKTNDKLVNTH